MKHSMAQFVELWVYLSATPLFGLTATLVVYVLAQAAYVLVALAWLVPDRRIEHALAHR